jgi:hypothetical protein
MMPNTFFTDLQAYFRREFASYREIAKVGAEYQKLLEAEYGVHFFRVAT